MSLAKDKPYDRTPSDYEDDFHAWAFEQAQLLRLGRFGEIDLPNLIEEIEGLGRDARRRLEMAYLDVIAGLMAWERDASCRKREDWKRIFEGRIRIGEEEADSRTLGTEAKRIIETVYPNAVRLAAAMTETSLDSFPRECPYSLDYLRNLDAIPGERVRTAGE